MYFITFLTAFFFSTGFSSLTLPDSNVYNVSLGFDCESVAYDSNNGWWLLADSTFPTQASSVRSWSPNGTYPTRGIFGPIYKPSSGTAIQFPTGLYLDTSTNILYVNNLANSIILGINTTNNETIYELDTSGQPNGLCYNSVNNMLYATDRGTNGQTQQIWELYMNLTVSRTFLSSDINIFPNGCIVNDDTLYVTQYYTLTNETIIDNLVVIYWTNISTSNPIRNRAGAPSGIQYSDGITMDNNGNLWISDWGDSSGDYYNGSLWYLSNQDINDPTALWQNVYQQKLRSPANIAYDPTLEWILIPSLFGQELIIVNPELESDEPTSAPTVTTGTPTDAPTAPTGAPIEDDSNSPIKFSQVSMLVVLCASFLTLLFD